MNVLHHKTDEQLKELIDMLTQQRITLATSVATAFATLPDAEDITKRNKYITESVKQQRTQIAFSLRYALEKLKDESTRR